MLVSRALAQCPGTQPAFSAVVNENPSILQTCRQLNTQGQCVTPEVPVAATSSTHAQETTLTATVPASITARSAHWLVERRNGDVWEELWRHKSIQGGTHAPGSTVTFGAPGLVEGADHMARVGFCDDKGTETTSDDECTCWSSAAVFTTTAYADLGPAKPPAPMLQKVEDQFDRPDTDPKCEVPGLPLGDGLGPLQVWSDCAGHEYVTQKNHDAWTSLSSVMSYIRQPANHPNSYAEMQVRVDDFGGPGFKYNLQVGTRLVPRIVNGTNSLTGYYLKLLLDARGCTEPTIMLVRLPFEYDSAKCDGTPFPHRMTLPTADCNDVPPDPNNKCNCAPPLVQEDTANRAGYSKPVWMRVEAKDVDGSLYPRFTGAVAWGDCPAGQPMSACERYCPFKTPDPDDDDMRVDVGDPQQMRGVIGTWGAGFHEKNYAIEVFRAGSWPAP